MSDDISSSSDEVDEVSSFEESMLKSGVENSETALIMDEKVNGGGKKSSVCENSEKDVEEDKEDGDTDESDEDDNEEGSEETEESSETGSAESYSSDEDFEMEAERERWDKNSMKDFDLLTFGSSTLWNLFFMQRNDHNVTCAGHLSCRIEWIIDFL